MDDDPLILAINTVTDSRINTRTHILDLLNNNIDDVKIAMDTLKHNIIQSQSSRRTTYKQITIYPFTEYIWLNITLMSTIGWLSLGFVYRHTL